MAELKGLIEGAGSHDQPGMEEQAPPAEQAAPEEDAGRARDMSPEGLRGKMEMPDDLRKVYERVVIAGKKVMYSEQTHELVLKQMRSGGPIEQRLGEGIGGLMILLFQQSNQSLPPQVLIPAGTELLADAADYLRQTGDEPLSDQQFGEALRIMVTFMLAKFGNTDTAQVESMLNQFQGA